MSGCLYYISGCSDGLFNIVHCLFLSLRGSLSIWGKVINGDGEDSKIIDIVNLIFFEEIYNF